MSRRNLEYQYEYGISLIGKAVANIQVAESRSQFLPAFHNLLKTAIDFYQQANYTTVIPDGFPVLNSLREVHLLLSEGSHNQFGSLPWAARAEMFIQQWLLSRPEMREFLGGRIMMPYNEEWMDKVDTMKTIQGWNPTNITHFHDLGAFGEQLLLSIRYGSWNDPSQTRDNAANWAYYWREEIQRYVHAYKAATGVDLGNDVTDARIAMPQNVERYTQPSVLIGRRVNSLPNNRPNFTSASYLGSEFSSVDLHLKTPLTLGKPAFLKEPLLNRWVANQIAKMQGLERGVIAPSSLHLFWDLFGILSKNYVVFIEENTYPIGQWGTIHADARQIPVIRFKPENLMELQNSIRKNCSNKQKPLIVCDALNIDSGKLAPIEEYLSLIEPMNGHLLIDDTQTFGIFGANPTHTGFGLGGGGILKLLQINSSKILTINSLSKAFGVPIAVLA
eukprot:gene26693-32254_t